MSASDATWLIIVAWVGAASGLIGLGVGFGLRDALARKIRSWLPGRDAG